MTESVADINEANGNGVAPQSHDDDWLRKVLLPTIGRYVRAQVRPLQQRIEELESKTKAAFLNQAKFITRIIL